MNVGGEWKDDSWQHYELDLRTWVFEEESFVPMALLLNGKVYSIVTDQLGTPTEAYNAEGEEVWRRRLDVMADGKKRRMHNSERQAKKQYLNAFAEEYRDLGYTSTQKAIGAEAKEMRTRRNKGEELPLNREKKKSYRKNS